ITLSFIAMPAPGLAAVTVTISPTNAYVAPGFDKQFTTTVSGAMNTAVVWSVNSVAGGNSSVGSISAGGKYIAPTGGAPGTQFTVQATSVEDGAAAGSAKVVIVNPSAILSSISPTSIPTGPFTLQVTGSNFMNGATVNWNGTALSTTFISSKSL